MGAEKITKFELNTKLLDNFDKVMSTKLDDIEELKITSLDRSSKLLNILSLCSNIKTLIIEGNQRINSDKVLSNIFHPDLVENLVINSAKLPSSKILKKFENINMVSINDIKIYNVKEMFEGLNSEKLEIINISNTNMSNNGIDIFSKFTNMKFLKLENVDNFKLNDLSFLKNCNQLLKIDIVGGGIPVNQINNLIQRKCSKNIELDVLGVDSKPLENCKLTIDDDKTYLKIRSEYSELFSKEVNCFKIHSIEVTIDELTENEAYIKLLKKAKDEANIIIRDFACLSVDQAKKIKEVLKLEKIQILDGRNVTDYNLDTFIEVHEEINSIINNVSKHVTEPEKFLEIYKYLGTEFTIVEKDANLKDKTCLIQDVSKLLDSCLQCMNISSNIIRGYDLENDRKHSWNQVKIEKRWYNVDLALDMENIKKNRADYCLLSDKEFLYTHSPKTGKNNYCTENFNPRLVKVFFRTGLFKDNLLGSYIEILVEKIRKIFNKEGNEVIALPSGDESEK